MVAAVGCGGRHAQHGRVDQRRQHQIIAGTSRVADRVDVAVGGEVGALGDSVKGAGDGAAGVVIDQRESRAGGRRVAVYPFTRPTLTLLVELFSVTEL